MKELSVEEKAKAYDEAIERAKKWYNAPNADKIPTYGNRVIEEIFPELKESEDKKIKKEIISFIQDDIDEINLKVSGDYDDRDEDDITHQNWCKKAIAWLEKQKTKKNEWLFEKGKWYVKLQHHYEGDLRHFEKGHVYQALSEVEITDGYHNVSLGSWEIPEYFRPATKDEIPEETKQTSRLDEDEEIRNYFINAVKEQPNIHQEWKEKCLNWLEKQGEKIDIANKEYWRGYREGKQEILDKYAELEKQGEHANFRNKIQIGDKVTRNEDGVLVNLSQLNRVAKKQTEQKPVVIIPKFRVGDEIKTSNEESLTITKIDEKGYWSEDLFICCFDEECVWDLVEQNPAWSEEDEKCLENAIMYCEWARDIAPNLHCYETSEKSINWLKSLKERYTWKPSDEQMDALHYVTNFDYGGHKATLVSLYEQLKKLKG